MPHFCFKILGQTHCFEVPLLIDKLQIKPPPPNNYPPFELALTVLELVKVIQPLAPNSSVVKELHNVSLKFVREVQAGLPEGVEFTHEHAAQERGAYIAGS